MTDGFIKKLEEEGYTINSKNLGCGYINDVQLITAHKGKDVIEYVLKKYKFIKDMEEMLRGYKLIKKYVKTPKIIYLDKEKKEVVYELIKGKNIQEMIESKDPQTHSAIKLLAKELEKLHKSRTYNPKYKKGNSPDERKMIKHCLTALESGNLSLQESDEIMKRIREYIPKTKSIIYGDAHFGNFIYSNNKIYFVDPDNVKIGDLNADVGKVLSAADLMESKKMINESEAKDLKELFLFHYEGEDEPGTTLLRLRTPLRIAKEFKEHPKIMITRVLEDLRPKYIVGFILTVTLGILLTGNTFTGRVIEETSFNKLPIYGLLVFFIILIILKLKNKE